MWQARGCPTRVPTGLVADPLNPDDTGDNYGVIMLADVMLKIARQTERQRT